MPPPAAAARRSGCSSPPSPAAATAAAGASPRLPGGPYVLFTRMATALSGEPTPETRGLRPATTSSAISVSWKLGVMRGRRSAFFGCFALGVGFLAGSSQERVAPWAREGARQSRRVRRAAPPAAEAGGRAGENRCRGGRASQAERCSFPRHPPPAGPLPPRRSLRRGRESPAPQTALRVAAAFHHCSFTSPPAPNFPQPGLARAYTHLHTHTRTHTRTPLPSLDSSSTSPRSLEMTDACRLSPNKRWGQQTTTVL